MTGLKISTRIEDIKTEGIKIQLQSRDMTFHVSEKFFKLKTTPFCKKHKRGLVLYTKQPTYAFELNK